MRTIRVILCSSVRPEPTSAGQIILHRHLTDRPEIHWEDFGAEPLRLTVSSAVRRVVGRLGRTKLRRFAHDFWIWRDGRWLTGLLPKNIPDRHNTVVLTVAHGDACGAAVRFARKQDLPLITLFHDWWPEMAAAHTPFQSLLENQFRRLYQQSDLALCVSKGMHYELGHHRNAEVLYPIPAKIESPCPLEKASVGFGTFYFGTLGEYGPMLGEAFRLLKSHPQVRLEVRGRNPNWPPAFREEMKEAGLLHDFAQGIELQLWQARADAFLVPMVFEESMRRRMETSFPSKMLEMAQFGKPLVIWGPEYCSAVQWARQGDRALCVTDPNPKALRQALESLAIAPAEQKRLADAARHAACTDFNPDRIHAQFMNALRRALTDRIGR